MTTNSFKTAVFAAVAIGASITTGTASANAFTVSGNIDFGFSNPPPLVTANFTNESVAGGFNPNFSPLGTPVTVADLPITLSGSNGIHPAIAGFIQGFQYQSQAAVFDLTSGTDTNVIASAGNFGALDFTFGGLIRSTGGDTLATVTGTFSAADSATNNEFSINLAATPVPTPALLPGLLGMGMGIVRKRKQQSTAA